MKANIFQKILIFFCTFFSIQVSALFLRGGGETQNGGGLAEYNILYAYKNLSYFYKLCFEKVELCLPNSEQRKIFLKIMIALENEKAQEGQIQFCTTLKDPVHCQVNSIASTGHFIRDKIYFNQDFLYKNNLSGQREALSILNAVAILTHELGHHQFTPQENAKDTSHAFLTMVGLAVENFLSQLTDVLKWDSYLENSDSTSSPLQVQVIAFHSDLVLQNDDSDTYSFLLIDDSVHLSELTSRIKQKFPCPLILTGYRFYGLHWQSPLSRFTKPHQIVLSLSMGLSINCGEDNSLSGHHYMIDIDLVLDEVFPSSSDPDRSLGWVLNLNETKINLSDHRKLIVNSVTRF